MTEQSHCRQRRIGESSVLVCVYESLRDGIYGIRSDAAHLKETVLLRQRRHGRGGVPWSALYLYDCETYNRSL